MIADPDKRGRVPDLAGKTRDALNVTVSHIRGDEADLCTGQPGRWQCDGRTWLATTPSEAQHGKRQQCDTRWFRYERDRSVCKARDMEIKR
ncbi:MAG: hypothetical protein R3E01_02705 [Pirellulaceae bacterium]